MTANLIPSAIIGVALVIGLANGLRRGSLKEGTALIGVLLGALLVEFWVERWSVPVSDRIGLRLENARMLIAGVLLFGTAFFSGYGSGLFIRRASMSAGERAGGALLGLLNTALLISFALRYMQQFVYGEFTPAEQVPSWIRNSLVSRVMLDWVGWVLLFAAAALGIFALITATFRISWAVTHTTPAKKPQPVGGAKPPQPAAAPRPLNPSSPFGGAPAGGQSAAPQQAPRTPPGQQESIMDRPPRTGP